MRADEAPTQLSSIPAGQRLGRLGFRRLTRAHLEWERRPGFGVVVRSVLPGLEAALGAALGENVEVKADLLPSRALPPQALGWGGTYFLLELSALGATALIELEPDLASLLLAQLFGSDAELTGASHLSKVESAGLGHLALVALAAIRAQPELEAQLSPRLSRITLDREVALGGLDAGAPHLSSAIRVKVKDREGRARLFCPAYGLQSLVQRYPEIAAPLEQLDPALAEARLPVQLRFGRTQLPSKDLDGLRPGDVLVCDGVQWRDGGVRGPISLGNAGLWVEGLALAQGMQVERVETSLFVEVRTMPHSPSSTEQMPVDIEVELASVRLSLGELARLRPGSLVPLHINVADPVLLRVGDRTVARAELVDLEGEVGARILTLLP